MKRVIPQNGDIYRDFTNKFYKILCVAKYMETGEDMVVYQALYHTFKNYVKPLMLFLSEVDTIKYPNATQKYAFEKISIEEDGTVNSLESPYNLEEKFNAWIDKKFRKMGKEIEPERIEEDNDFEPVDTDEIFLEDISAKGISKNIDNVDLEEADIEEIDMKEIEKIEEIKEREKVDIEYVVARKPKIFKPDSIQKPESSNMQEQKSYMQQRTEFRQENRKTGTLAPSYLIRGESQNKNNTSKVGDIKQHQEIRTRKMEHNDGGEHLIKFLDAKTYADKKSILLFNKKKFTQKDLDCIYTTLDLQRFAGNEIQQVLGLVRYFDMQEEYEGSRLRLE